jgi:L-ornithine N5-oxygenase
VVRLELIEHLYEKMYHQRRTLGVDEKKWPHRLLPGRKIVNVSEKGDKLHAKVAVCLGGEDDEGHEGPLLDQEDLEVDLIICATGYQRRAHLDMLKDAWPLLPEVDAAAAKTSVSKDRWLVQTPGAGPQHSTRALEVGRDYGIRFSAGAVAQGSGVWLQGCCEGTHGVSSASHLPTRQALTRSQLSDTLLSVLSTRSGEMVESIFGAGSR